MTISRQPAKPWNLGLRLSGLEIKDFHKEANRIVVISKQLAQPWNVGLRLPSLGSP